MTAARFNGCRGLWAEVKPPGDAAEKARAFAVAGDQQILILDGEPDFRVYTCVSGSNPDPHADWPGGLVEETVMFLGKYLPGGGHGEEYRLYWDPGFERADGSLDEKWVDCAVTRAIHSARSARFEFGERGARP